MRTGADGSEVRALHLHLARFRAGIERVARSHAINTDALDVDSFLASAVEAIARTGECFPRLELCVNPASARDRGTGARQRTQLTAPEAGLALRVSLRPLPKLTETVELVSARTPPPVDARTKGPNISRYSRLNQRTGAETLLLDADGSVREGATTSLLVWDRGTLLVSASVERVDSVCERLVSAHARERGLPVERRALLPEELIGRELWAVNALHGIRPVVALDGVERHGPADEARLREFREALDSSFAPIDASGR